MEYSKFEKLQPKKRQRIINAALYEFALYGEAKASSNRIVKCAGIGKGMLFYYFGNMEGVFRYLHLYAHAKLNTWISEAAALDANILARWRCLLDSVQKNHEDEPALAAFVASIHGRFGKSTARKADCLHDMALMRTNMDKLYQRADISCFSEDVGADIGLKCIRHVMQASVREAMNTLSEAGVEPEGFLTTMEQLQEMLMVLCRLHCKAEAVAC